MRKFITVVILATLLAGCGAGYNPNVSGQTGRAESDALNADSRAENAKASAEASAKGGEQ